MANSVTVANATDNFALAAASGTSAVTGEKIRFSKGLYLLGRGDGERLPVGRTLQAIDVVAAWTKFVDGRIVDQRAGFPLCSREDLGDLDEDLWPRGIDGKPDDPWVNQRYLYLLDPDAGEDFTFVTSSWGGRGAVEALVRSVSIKRTSVPGAIPVVRLDVGYRRSAKFGNVPAPKFCIVGWVGGEVAPTLAPAPLSAAIDDDIPF